MKPYLYGLAFLATLVLLAAFLIGRWPPSEGVRFGPTNAGKIRELEVQEEVWRKAWLEASTDGKPAMRQHAYERWRAIQIELDIRRGSK